MRRPRDIGASLHRAIPWLNALLVAMLAWSSAQLTWRLVPEEESTQAPLPVPVATTPSPGKQANKPGLGAVAALHLFGDAEEAPALEAEAPITAPETRLNLTLKGLFAVDAQELALAIISQGSSDEEAYRVGDTVPGGATLHEIHSDRVILKRGGRFETLTLPKESMIAAEAANPTAGVTSTPPRMPSRPPGIMPPRPTAPNGPQTASPQQLQAVRERILSDPQEAMKLINAQPVMEGGEMKGYRVTPGRDRRLFSSVGLRPGDIVTSVNGIPLNDPQQMGELFSQMSKASRLDVTVERGGRPSQLSIDLNN